MFTYTPGGLLDTYNPPDVPGLTSDKTTYEYDNQLRLKKVNRPDGTSVTYDYDELGRLQEDHRPRRNAHADLRWLDQQLGLDLLARRHHSDLRLRRQPADLDRPYRPTRGKRRAAPTTMAPSGSRAETVDGVKVTYQYDHDGF